MNKQDADVLYAVVKNGTSNQRVISESSKHSLGIVNRSVKNLKSEGYLNEYSRPTAKAIKRINKGKTKSAIILAAGLGMRMIPTNALCPKAFIEIQGERLIERLIKQLNNVGIFNITVVTGFMKDSFEYLIDDYAVKLVYAKNYMNTNTLHSLAAAVDCIDNTYILPADIWCKNNPFQTHEMYSWYMISEEKDSKSEIRLGRKSGLLKKESNAEGNKMIGIAYLCGKEAQLVKHRIKGCIEEKKYEDKYWEEVLYEKDRMIVSARVSPGSEIIEINTYEELREIDSESDQLKTDTIQIISDSLGCDIDSIVDIEILKKGMTNQSFSFRTTTAEKTEKFIMRIPGVGTDKLINRKDEADVYKAIRGLNFCEDPVYINSKNGYKITKYIENARCCNPESEEDVRKCMRKLRTFHNYKVRGKHLSVAHVFDLFERIEYYESLWNGTPSIFRDYKKTKDNCRKLLPFIEKYKEPFQLTHIDAVPDNFLFDPNSEGELAVQLTDWEYAGMQDKHVDIAMFCIYSLYDKNQIDHLVDIYFEDDGGCTSYTRAKIYAYISLCGLLWSNWCELKRNMGVEFGEYSLRQYRFAKEYYQYAVNEIKLLH